MTRDSRPPTDLIGWDSTVDTRRDHREARAAVVVEEHSETDGFLRDVKAGLSSSPKRIPCKYFYDDRGSRLFEQICEVPEYYPTRTELEIMSRHKKEMASQIGPGVRLVEFGSGSSVKTRILLEALASPSVYIPVDISHNHLIETCSRLATDYSGLEVLPLVADYSTHLVLPESSSDFRRTVAYFPGSTIGNFNEREAHRFLHRVRRLVGDDGALLIGMDLEKDPAVLLAAYDDRAGVTAQFNLNLLERMRRQLGAEVKPATFSHVVRYNSKQNRIELYLRSRLAQTISVGGESYELAQGELIHTENCHKYNMRQARDLAVASGFRLGTSWQGPDSHFSVQYWEARAHPGG